MSLPIHSLPPPALPYISDNNLNIEALSKEKPQVFCETFITLCDHVYSKWSFDHIELIDWADPLELTKDEKEDIARVQHADDQSDKVNKEPLPKELKFTYKVSEQGPIKIDDFIYTEDLIPKINESEKHPVFPLLESCFAKIEQLKNREIISLGQFVHCYVHFVSKVLTFNESEDGSDDDRDDDNIESVDFAEAYNAFALQLKPNCSREILECAHAINQIIPKLYPIFVDTLPQGTFFQKKIDFYDGGIQSYYSETTLLQFLLKSPYLRRIYNGEEYNHKIMQKNDVHSTLCIYVESPAIAKALAVYIFSDTIPFFEKLTDLEVLYLIQHALQYEMYPLVGYCGEQLAEQGNLDCLNVLLNPDENAAWQTVLDKTRTGKKIDLPKLKEARDCVETLTLGKTTGLNLELVATLFQLFPNVFALRFSPHRIAVSLMEQLHKMHNLELVILEGRDLPQKTVYLPNVKLFLLKGETKSPPVPPKPATPEAPILDLRGLPKISIAPLVTDLKLSDKALNYLITC